MDFKITFGFPTSHAVPLALFQYCRGAFFGDLGFYGKCYYFLSAWSILLK
jgi:hypothetical protein